MAALEWPVVHVGQLVPPELAYKAPGRPFSSFGPPKRAETAYQTHILLLHVL
ncbi:hypothetical protein CCACVL1_26365 [Corchorus capsularis]|uniref:Uncharacterized protein n=1 Tax=Corchorus capsularis TaxID=210143 RepID=A0A1R3GF42_COCAP|nr:hypothetical protein CCACVL1_26365 [Corchorus capsularis]